jgi:hypothetical protein
MRARACMALRSFNELSAYGRRKEITANESPCLRFPVEVQRFETIKRQMTPRDSV